MLRHRLIGRVALEVELRHRLIGSVTLEAELRRVFIVGETYPTELRRVLIGGVAMEVEFSVVNGDAVRETDTDGVVKVMVLRSLPASRARYPR